MLEEVGGDHCEMRSWVLSAAGFVGRKGAVEVLGCVFG